MVRVELGLSAVQCLLAAETLVEAQAMGPGVSPVPSLVGLAELVGDLHGACKAACRVVFTVDEHEVEMLIWACHRVGTWGHPGRAELVGLVYQARRRLLQAVVDEVEQA